MLASGNMNGDEERITEVMNDRHVDWPLGCTFGVETPWASQTFDSQLVVTTMSLAYSRKLVSRSRSRFAYSIHSKQGRLTAVACLSSVGNLPSEGCLEIR